jgi:hypothetical protein
MRVRSQPLPTSGWRARGAAAEVAPGGLAVAGDVVVDRELAGADLDGRALGGAPRAGAAGEADELELERLVGHLGTRLVLGDDAADEPLVLADDPLHLLLDRLEVFGVKGRRRRSRSRSRR